MKKFLLQIWLFSVPVVASAILLFCINPDKQFSYRFVEGECSNKAGWIYDRVFLSHKGLDVVFIGASQTACAVKDELIERRLVKLTGDSLGVASLGYCRGGRDIQYVMLKDVFRHNTPRLVVVEVTEDEPKKSHPVFPYLAETEDLIGSAVFFNQRYIVSLWKGLVIRYEYLRANLFGTCRYSGDPAANYGYIPNSATAGQDLLQQNRLSWERRLHKSKPAFLRTAELHYSQYYLEKIVKMAGKYNSRVMFLYMRESGSRLQEPMLLDYYRNLAEIIILPDSVFANPVNWADATHLNDSGATLASEQIARQLIGVFSGSNVISVEKN